MAIANGISMDVRKSSSMQLVRGLLHMTVVRLVALLLVASGCVDIDRRVWTPDIEQVRVEIIEIFLKGEETARIYEHLGTVEQELRSADTRALDDPRREARETSLARLHTYREARAYPHNHADAERTPIFIDTHGTRCAMAHLIERAGGAPFVQRIAASRNFAYVDELADEPELGAWLDRNGLTVAEAARIQPTYDRFPSRACIIGQPIDLEPDEPGLQPDISASLVEDAANASVAQVLPPCGVTTPCYELEHDPRLCPGTPGLLLSVEGTSATPRRARVEIVVSERASGGT